MAVASGLAGNDDAVQCLRAAIAAVLTTGTGSVAAEGIPWVSNVVATSYTDSDSAMGQVSKVTFSISMKGIDAQTVLDDLMNAAVDTTNLMAQLNLRCGWPFDAIDKESTDHVLQYENVPARHRRVGGRRGFLRARIRRLFGARQFNADSVARCQVYSSRVPQS